MSRDLGCRVIGKSGDVGFAQRTILQVINFPEIVAGMDYTLYTNGSNIAVGSRLNAAREINVRV